MRSSDEKQAREEETIGEPVGSGHASRKGRLTPRQLWARQERGRTKGQASEKPQAAKKGRSKAAEAEAAALGEDEKAYEEPFYEGPVLEESVEAGAEETGVVEEPADIGKSAGQPVDVDLLMMNVLSGDIYREGQHPQNTHSENCRKILPAQEKTEQTEKRKSPENGFLTVCGQKSKPLFRICIRFIFEVFFELPYQREEIQVGHHDCDKNPERRIEIEKTEIDKEGQQRQLPDPLTEFTQGCVGFVGSGTF